MSKLLWTITCLLLLHAARAEAACEREFAALRLPPGYPMTHLDGDIRHDVSESGWDERLNRLGPRPSDPSAALRMKATGNYAPMSTAPGQDQNASVRFAFLACRARDLADQLEAPKLAREQAARDAAARVERERLDRDRLQRERLQGERLERERLGRVAREQRERALLETERLRLEREAQEAQAREEALRMEEAARLEEEAARLEAEAAAADKLRAAREAEKRRQEREAKEKEKEPFEGRNVSECIGLLTPENPFDEFKKRTLYGGFQNRCDFPVYVAYCAYRPKQGEFSAAFDCDQNKGGLDHIEARGIQSAHTRHVERMFWFACNAPSTPQVQYQSGTGFYGACR